MHPSNGRQRSSLAPSYAPSRADEDDRMSVLSEAAQQDPVLQQIKERKRQVQWRMRALELLKTGAAQERQDPHSERAYYVLTSTREAYWSLEEVLGKPYAH